MAIKIIKESEDGKEVTVSKEELESLQTAASENFSKGYNKGKEKGIDEGKSDLLRQIDFLDIDPNDLDGSLKTAKETIKALKEKKGKDSEEVATLKEQLTKKQAALDEVTGAYNSFKQSTLIDGKIKDLAAEAKAVNPLQAALIFKNEFNIGLNDKNEVIVKDPNTGNPMFDDKGDPVKLEDVFTKNFSKNNPHLFEGAQNGGSGGGGGENFAGVTKLSDLKTDADKAKFVNEQGLEAYQKLIQESAAAKTE